MASVTNSIAQWFSSGIRALSSLGRSETGSDSLSSNLPPRLRISSPCEGSCLRVAELGRRKKWEGQEDEDDPLGDCIQWQGFCSCCKRPLTISEDRTAPPSKRARHAESGPCAFVVAVWGTTAEYVLGAVVLGYSLRQTGTKHDLVVMHTADVPKAAVSLLAKAGWKPHQVDYVKACGRVFHESCAGMRFEQVFTKLHVFNLTRYRKVIMLDADLLVKENIDDLFDMAAPAALARGPWSGYSHGDRIDCSYFFGGARENSWSWGQASGINAGVMLLEPSQETYEQCLAEVADRNHPEHIRGSGPEQDYLSRFFAGQWTHIDVAYNFQLHHMYFALSPKLQGADRVKFFNRPDLIKVFHYSSDPKPWARQLHADYSNYTVEAIVAEIKKDFRGYRAWVLKDLQAINMELMSRHGEPGAALGSDGRVRQHRSEDSFVLGDVVEASERNIHGCEAITRLSVDLWDQAYRGVSTELGERDLARVVMDAVSSRGEVVSGDSNKASSDQVHKNACADSKSKTWNRQDGWWIEQLRRDRALATCSIFPQPHAVFRLSGTSMLSAPGEGLHIAAAVADNERLEVRSFACDFKVSDVVDWVKELPEAAMVLLAAVDIKGSLAADLFAALVDAGLGCPALPPPPELRAMVAMGRKGNRIWHSTHAAVDIASVSGSL